MGCDGDSAAVQETYAGLESDIRKVIERMKKEGRIRRAAVFVRALDDGPTLAIDEYSMFTPASLIKLPVVLTFFRMEEDQPGLLQEELLYEPSTVTHFTALKQVERSGAQLHQGQRYSIQALMRSTLVHSDNLAYYLLLEYLNHTAPSGRAWFTRTFQELGVVDPGSVSAETMSARGYARVLRMLYDASYLDVRESELVLSWLAESQYDRGLAAGVPAKVTVGNKFGERVLADGSKQLHDCGIVFLPGHPYSMCVMTDGDDFEELRTVIRQISTMTYDELSTRAHSGTDGINGALVGILGKK